MIALHSPVIALAVIVAALMALMYVLVSRHIRRRVFPAPTGFSTISGSCRASFDMYPGEVYITVGEGPVRAYKASDVALLAKGKPVDCKAVALTYVDDGYVHRGLYGDYRCESGKFDYLQVCLRDGAEVLGENSNV